MRRDGNGRFATTRWTRRELLGWAATGAAASAIPLTRAADPSPSAPSLHREFPAQDPVLVKQVVGLSHRDLDGVRELVTARPALAKAAWDWGFGDWETALGAASHVGRPDIAELLIEHGARPDLFTHAMLGHLEAVRAIVAARPGIQRLHGPHGIPLLDHAKAGGERAAAVVAFLETAGHAGERSTSLELGAEGKQLYVGRYPFGPAEEDVLEVAVSSRGDLTVARVGQTSRVLHRVEEHGFAPAGASDVRLRFEVAGGKVTALTVHDPEPVVRALRID